MESVEKQPGSEGPGQLDLYLGVGVETELSPLPQPFLTVAAAQKLRCWVCGGKTIKLPTRMRTMAYTPPQSPGKPHLYPCPPNTPRVIVVSEPE